MVPHYQRLCFIALFVLVTACQQREGVDLLLVNAEIYTVDEAKPWAEALAIREGQIVGVGDDQQIRRAFRGPEKDMRRQMILPGLHDSHSHLIYGGLQLMQCNLVGLADQIELLSAIRECDQALPAGAWLVGAGFDLSIFPGANPSKQLLDVVNAERRMFIRGADGHSAWVSSAALDDAGIGFDSPDPENGIIERDDQLAPSGVLRESAMLLVEDFLPRLNLEARQTAGIEAIALAHRFGITSVIDAATTVLEAEAYEALAETGQLNMRMVLAMSVIAPFFEPAPVESVRPEDLSSEQLVKRQSLKIFVDGVLEGETAALLAPYISETPHRGMLITPAEILVEKVVAYDAMGIQLMFHAIGDRGVRVALDAIEAARRVNGDQDLRHHISHLQLIDPEDQSRFARLNVAANFQALWALPDTYVLDINLPAVGAERVERMYPIRSLQQGGARVVGGSDWPVSSMNPLLAIETALTRSDPAGNIEGVLNAEERVSLESMIEAYTKNGAWLMHQEQLTGQIQVGKKADLVVLSENLFGLPPEKIGEVEVVATYFDGREVYTHER